MRSQWYWWVLTVCCHQCCCARRLIVQSVDLGDTRRYSRCRVHVEGTGEGIGKDGSRDQEGGRLGASRGGEGGWSMVD